MSKCKKVSFQYDRNVDAAYLTLKEPAIVESAELGRGIIVDFDSANQVVGVEILRFMKRFRARGAAVKAASAKRRGK